MLDVSSRAYTTLMRSHVSQILSASIDPLRRHLATVSEDKTIRIWDLDTLQQVTQTWQMSCFSTPCEGWWLEYFHRNYLKRIVLLSTIYILVNILTVSVDDNDVSILCLALYCVECCNYESNVNCAVPVEHIRVIDIYLLFNRTAIQNNLWILLIQ